VFLLLHTPQVSAAVASVLILGNMNGTEASVKAALARVSCSSRKGLASSEESSRCKYVTFGLKEIINASS
jgi:hypothetical protein